jgi:hypothetical protein
VGLPAPCSSLGWNCWAAQQAGRYKQAERYHRYLVIMPNKSYR